MKCPFKNHLIGTLTDCILRDVRKKKTELHGAYPNKVDADTDEIVLDALSLENLYTYVLECTPPTIAALPLPLPNMICKQLYMLNEAGVDTAYEQVNMLTK